jgi:glycosyltransferase involved in cell wall biosynthesis
MDGLAAEAFRTVEVESNVIVPGVKPIRKKVVLVTPFPTGKHTGYAYMKTRAIALKELYDLHIVHVNIAKGATNGVVRYEENGYSVYRIDVNYWNVPRIGFFYHQAQIKAKLSELIRELEPDLAHVHFSHYYSWIVKEICTKIGLPYCISEHASHFEQSIASFWIGRRIRGALSQANKVFAVSESLRRTMLQFIGRDIEVKPNCVDTNRFVLKPYGRPRGPIVQLLTIGALDLQDKKGYELLLRSLGELRLRDDRFVLRIVGDGANRKKLEQLIEDYHLKEHVVMLGGVPNDQLVNLYHEADFFISSSRVETFGVVMIEAMSCGLPVLATKSGGAQALISPKSGLLVEPESLCEGIERMMQLYDSFDSNEIRQRIVDRYSTEVYLSTMKGVYDDVIAASRNRNDYREAR